MKAARNRRKKNNFVKKFKSFIVYSFISIVVLGFFLNTFLSNILEYSFALANSGGIVDIKTDEKYSVVLIATNKLNEVKKANLITYDKKNRKLINFNLNNNLELNNDEDTIQLGDILSKYSKDPEKINMFLSVNFGTQLASTYITSSDNYDLLEKLLLGKSNIYDLYTAKDLENISLRDIYFISSFAGSIESNNKREVLISNLEALDTELKDIYIDSELGVLSPSITVVNTTKINGLGKKFTRYITNLGGRVVDTLSAGEPENESFIVYKDRTDGLNYLMSKLGIKKSLSIEEVGLKYPQFIKSDFVVVLGIDKEK